MSNPRRASSSSAAAAMQQSHLPATLNGHHIREPQLINKYQPNHKFLDQLTSKSPMCLVNEICRHHRLKPEYTLLHTSGPDHAKKFCVSLTLNEKEKFNGDGSSIKNAQRAAATCALQNTQLSFPKAQTSRSRPQTTARAPLLTHNQTPASELNTLLMKNGIQPKYELTVEKLSNETMSIPFCINYPIQTPPNFYDVPKNGLLHFKSHNQRSPNSINNQAKLNNFNHHIPQMQFLAMPIPVPINPNFVIPHPYMYQTQPPPYVRPNQAQRHVSSTRDTLSSQQFTNYNANFDYYSYNHALVSSYQNSKQNHNKWHSPNIPNLPPHRGFIQNSPTTRTTYEAKIEFDGQNFCGRGPTAQVARHSAANEALRFVKGQHKQKRISTSTLHAQAKEEQSPISSVYEIASRNRYKVLFELVHESGQVHMPKFQMRCLLYSANPKEPFLSVYGEDRSKKAAKKSTAENMLKAMKTVFTDDFSRTENNTVNNKNLANQSPTKLALHEQSSRDPENSNLCLLDSCKFTALLYEIARNLCIKRPSFRLTSVAENDPITKSFIAHLSDSNTTSISQSVCELEFDQRLPQQYKCLAKTVGFGQTPQMAKSVAAYICLIKIGIQPPSIDNESDGLWTKALQFSWEKNTHMPAHIDCLDPKSSLAPFKKDSNEVNLQMEELSADVITTIEQNIQFVIHILGKIYLFILKDSSKSTEGIFSKLESALNTFYSTHYPNVSAEQLQAKLSFIANLTATLDGSKYWSHLLLISSLLLMNIHDQDLFKESFLIFKSQLLKNEDDKLETETETSQHICIIGAHCNRALERKFKLEFIKENFVNFGLGASEVDAQEVASFWTLKNLSYVARKQIIENEFDQSVLPMASGHLQPTSTNDLSNESNSDETDKSRSCKSHRSHLQVITKQCISRLFTICAELNIRKPTFECLPLPPQFSAIQNETFPGENLVFVQCAVNFVQEWPEQISSSLVVHSIGISQRFGHTIGAYLALHQLGFPTAEHNPELFDLNNFESQVKLSIQANPSLSFTNLHQQTQSDTKQTDLNQLIEQNCEEFSQNLDFLEHILQTIYRPFLKNHKMVSPAHLFERIEQELFEYHNQKQQMNEGSSAFDASSEHIYECIRQLVGQFDGSQFWHHLQLLSSIVSLLTRHLAQVHPVFSIKCHICPSASTQPNTSNTCHSPTDAASSSAAIPVAIIHLSSHLPSTTTNVSNLINKKSFLSFALGQSEVQARETASYKALRHLAINLWK